MAQVLQSIFIKTPPGKIEYQVGELFDTTGMIVGGMYQRDNNILQNGDDTVVLSLTEDGVTKSASQEVSCDSLISIEVTTLPDKLKYLTGQIFDTTGMVVTATYASGQTKAVTNYTYAPTTPLTDDVSEITITYTEDIRTASTLIGANDGFAVLGEYSALQYIESSGTQYINTGLIFAEGYYVEMNMMFNTVTSPTVLIGSISGSDNRNTIFVWQNCFAWSSSKVYYTSNSVQANVLYAISCKFSASDTATYLDVNGERLTVTSSYSTGYGLSSTPVYLFALNNGGTAVQEYVNGKFYGSISIYSDSFQPAATPTA